MHDRRIGPLLAVVLAGVGLVWTADGRSELPLPEVRLSAHHDTSRPISVTFGAISTDTPSTGDSGQSSIGNSPEDEGGPDKGKPNRGKFLPRPRLVGLGADPVAQRSEFGTRSRSPFAPSAPIVGSDFDSIGETMEGFNVNAAPPDTSMAVGLDQIVVMVNSGIVVHDKDGNVLEGPFSSSDIWAGFGGDCENYNDGDGIVRYDRLANRWIISQFAVSGAEVGDVVHYECIAVSTSDDATGSYYRYAFAFDDFPDYPKLSVWPDAYYVSYNMFDPNTSDYLGAKVCATDRESMLIGDPATQVCFDTSNAYGGLLAADLDSETPPPSGAPNTIVSIGYFNNELATWMFDVDFENPLDSTFTGPEAITAATYVPACYIDDIWYWNCIEQLGTSNDLDALDDRLMNRLAYRNFGDHQSLVVTHAVRDSGRIGIRWYELRLDAESTPSVFQQGTYIPDVHSRWMSSAAVDQQGNIAIGYSKSSSTMYPAIAYTGRLVDDPAGTLTMGETIAQEGGGAQTGTLHRWGDYSTMNIDPADDCTFWFATEYLPATGAFNWATHVNSFSFPDCESDYDFSLDLEADALTLAPGGEQEVEVEVTTTSGSPGDVTLDVDGLPTGVTAEFEPALLDEGTSLLTLTATNSATPGTIEITISATGGGLTREAVLDLTVTDFGFSISPNSGSTTSGGTVNGTFASTVSPGRRVSLVLSASGLPTGARVNYSRSRISAGSRGSFRVITGSSTPAGTHEITMTATGPNYSISRTFTLTVSDFSVGLTPSSASKTRSTTQLVTVDTAVTAGSTQSLNLSVGRLPRGVAARFSSTRVNAGSSPTLTLTIASNARPGTYTITVSARGTTKTKSTNFTLTIT